MSPSTSEARPATASFSSVASIAPTAARIGWFARITRLKPRSYSWADENDGYSVGTATSGVRPTPCHEPRKPSISWSVLSREWMRIASTPASTYASARSQASATPWPAIRLSTRAIRTKSSVSWARLAAASRRACSSTGISSRFVSAPRRLFRFGKRLSSMLIALIPARSYSTSVRTTLPSPPNPLSQSAITGNSVAASIRIAAARVSLIVVRLRSGSAWAIVATPRPLTQTASKPSCWPTSFAVSASWAPTATSARVPRRPSLSRRRFASALFMAVEMGSEDIFPLRDGWIESIDDCHDLASDLLLGVDRLRADMGRQNDVREVRERRALAFALGHVDVEGGATQPPAWLEGFEERRLVDDAATGDVDEECAGLHPRQFARADHASSQFRERYVQRDEVALLEDLIDVREVDAALGERDGAVDAGVFDDADRTHFPGQAQRRDSRPDGAESDDPQSLPAEVVTDELRLDPVSLAQAPVGDHDAAGERDHQPKCQLRYRLGAGSGDADKLDRARSDGRQVEVVESGAGPDEEAKVRCREDRRANAHPAAEDDGLPIGGGGGEVRFRGTDRQPHVVSLLEERERGRCDLAGDEDPHHDPVAAARSAPRTSTATGSGPSIAWPVVSAGTSRSAATDGDGWAVASAPTKATILPTTSSATTSSGRVPSITANAGRTEARSRYSWRRRARPSRSSWPLRSSRTVGGASSMIARSGRRYQRRRTKPWRRASIGRPRDGPAIVLAW